MVIVKDTVFDTPFESGCVALESPNEFGGFDAVDSEGVVCQFHVAMVVGESNG